jgi:hypothetical protein
MTISVVVEEEEEVVIAAVVEELADPDHECRKCQKTTPRRDLLGRP